VEYTQFLWVLLVFAIIGGYYVYYFRKIKKSGGWEAIQQRVAQAKWGLGPGETAPYEWNGEIYIGPLVPGSGPSAMEKVGGFLTNTTYRGRHLMATITSQNRLVFSAEPLEGENKGDASIGDMGYRPWLVFTKQQTRPKLIDPHVAWSGHPQLEKELKRGGERHNRMGQMVKFQLAVLQLPNGEPLALWLDPEAIPQIHSWCTT
jgi:hypothetical protein